MPRRPRGELRGEIHHVLNRGNNRQAVFHDERDHREFIQAMRNAKARIPIEIYSFTTMSNHFHAVMRPRDIDTLSRFVHAWLSDHASKHNRRYDLPGHIWQGRFKAFPVAGDDHFLTVMKYVLQNPVRAGLVANARDYPWSSLNHRAITDPWPLPVADIDAWLGDPVDPRALESLRNSVNRQLPFGTTAWTKRTAAALGLPTTPPRRGRPPKRGTGPD
jgi:putative transposase